MRCVDVEEAISELVGIATWNLLLLLLLFDDETRVLKGLEEEKNAKDSNGSGIERSFSAFLSMMVDGASLYCLFVNGSAIDDLQLQQPISSAQRYDHN